MNGLLQAGTAAQIIANGHAIHNKLRAPQRAHGFTRQALKIIAESRVCRPLWQTMAISFDWHVAAWEAEHDPEKYVEHTAAKHGYSLKDLFGNARHDEIVEVRGLIAYDLRYKFNLRYPVIARLMQRDHTTQITRVKIHCAKIGEDYAGREISVIGEQTLNAIRAAYEAGGTIRELCTRMGVSRYLVVKYGVMQGWYVKKVKKQYRPALNLDRESIKADLLGGMSAYKLAIKHNVSNRSMYRYIHGWGLRAK